MNGVERLFGVALWRRSNVAREVGRRQPWRKAEGKSDVILDAIVSLICAREQRCRMVRF